MISMAVIVFACNVASGLVSTYWQFFSIRILTGALCSVGLNASIILRMSNLGNLISFQCLDGVTWRKLLINFFTVAEIVTSRNRALMMFLYELLYSLGTILNGLLFYIDPNWRHFELYISTLPAILLICLL